MRAFNSCANCSHNFKPVSSCLLAILLLGVVPHAVAQGKPQDPHNAPPSRSVAARTASSNTNPARDTGSAAQASIMTNVDVLRLLELGVPTPVIVERIRANQTHFTKLDGLLAAIRSRDRSGKDPRFLWLVAEISAALYREGAPCAQASAACYPLSAELTDPAPADSMEAVAASTDPSPQPAKVVPALPPSAPAAAPVADPPPASAKPAAATVASTAAPQSAQPAATSPQAPGPVAPPTQVPGASAPVISTGPQNMASQMLSQAAQRFVRQQAKIMEDEKERNKCRNPYVVIDPLRLVFDTTEVGEHIERDIGVSIKPDLKELKILSIQPSRTDDLERPPEAFSLVQPDLQCPEVASSDGECHLKVQFHPVRDGYASAYIDIVTEIQADAMRDNKQPPQGCDSAQPNLYFDRAYIHGTGYVSDVARLDGTGPLSNQPGLRSVMGFDISGASNAQTQQKFFLEFNINAPIGFARLGKNPVSCMDYPSLPQCKRKSVRFDGEVFCDDDYGLLTECKGKPPTEKASIDRTLSCADYPFLPECRNRNLVRVDTEVHCRDVSAEPECANQPADKGVQLHRSLSCTDYPALPQCDIKNPPQLERRDPLSRPLWFFLNPRITSVPQSPNGLGSLNIQSISDSILSDKNTTSLVQGMDVTGGLEYFVIKPRQGLPFWSVVKNARARTGLALVAGVGFTTPFSPPDKTTQEFNINSTITKQFPDALIPQPPPPDPNSAPPTIIAFVNKDRTRFFRRYYTGLRFKTYFFSDRIRGECDDPRSEDGCEAVINLFPGVFDLTVGKDEAVTGGRFSNWVLRLDAVYPLPFNPAFHIFGGANVAFGRNTTTLPLVLEPPQTFLNLSDPHVFVQALDPPNRDTYRIGIGVDLLQIIKSKAGKPAAAPEPQKESSKN